MKYLITSIKEIEDIITPSLVIDDFFAPFPFPKQEEYFRSCMRLYRIETFGEDYEKSPISFEEFNPRYDKFYGLNYNRLTEIIEIEEFKIDLKQLLIRHEDYFTEGIAEQLPNPSEAEFKMFLYNSLCSEVISALAFILQTGSTYGFSTWPEFLLGAQQLGAVFFSLQQLLVVCESLLTGCSCVMIIP